MEHVSGRSFGLASKRFAAGRIFDFQLVVVRWAVHQAGPASMIRIYSSG
jgi:hypothetical protein